MIANYGRMEDWGYVFSLFAHYYNMSVEKFMSLPYDAYKALLKNFSEVQKVMGQKQQKTSQAKDARRMMR